MPIQLSAVTFYLPFHIDGLEAVPADADEYWPWIVQLRGINEGKYSWTLQTYLQLRRAGLACTLSSRFPDHGIVISHRDFLPALLRPRNNVFLICIKPDRKAHSWAHFYIAQNSSDRFLSTKRGKDRHAVMPLWPQPGLLPRLESRGTTCSNVSYFGRLQNLTEELVSSEWSKQLEALGFAWCAVSKEHWHDYRKVDVMVAVRSFAASVDHRDQVGDADVKPPSKLINSWIAGVPAIVGHDTAFHGIRRSQLDYIEVTSKSDLLDALRKLRANHSLYSDMVANGRERAAQYSAPAVSDRWLALLHGSVAEHYENWRKMKPIRRFWVNWARVASVLFTARNYRDAAISLTRKAWPQ